MTDFGSVSIFGCGPGPVCFLALTNVALALNQALDLALALDQALSQALDITLILSGF